MAALTRRTFLARSSVAAGGVVALGAAACSGDDDSGGDGGAGDRGAAAGTTAPAFDPADWDSVRDQFPLDPEVAHFAAFVLAAHPRPVAEAVERHRAGLDADTHAYLASTEQDAESGVRVAAAEYLGAGGGAEVGLTDSTTMGLGLLCGSGPTRRC
jgi:hypothetical protein